MVVASPLNPTDHFHFNSSSPTTISQLYNDFNHRKNSPATVPFAWEEKPGIPKSTTTSSSFTNDSEFDPSFDFEFDLSFEFHHNSVSADDLFHAGIIKPTETLQERGRQRNCSGLSSSKTRRTRSLSLPLDLNSRTDAPNTKVLPINKEKNTSFSSSATLSASGSGKGSKKWSFKDLFLFRSASDGRALDRDPLKKYSGAVFRKHDEDLKNLSLRNRVGSDSGSGSGLKTRKGRVSAHELHYTLNRAVSNDMKKKTFLPYKQGILGRLAFNPSVPAVSNGFGFSHRK
ncbi:hypothetical protein QVD17_25189 [Tagetes erecta]|uniref:Uncharacterized protein n=1 Tax=Tagetes erecta TaxID=13708 RepID=A0AAD8NUZ6_TARER|nr:hypothetical protein QVD17_25189 [Tagetes erecta]